MKKKRHPYLGLPDSALWRRGVAGVDAGEIDPVVDTPFVIGPGERIAAAGSCFAQHIGRYLRAGGRNFVMTEPPHPLFGARAIASCNYGTFSARYGNIYTARQLLQLIERAYGRFVPQEDLWREGPRRFLDPFRPSIQPGGFTSEREFRLDRAQHFAAVRRMFETLDVLVFTLGLTEAWRSRRDGAVFPVCPGTAGGAFDARRHEFVNLTVEETIADLRAFVAALKAVNSRARLVLTVSPVPLAATAERQHVLAATVYSKSVLRVAAETVARDRSDVAYFPSYEIVASGFAGAYFGPDRRSVTEAGVAHVMRVFARHYLGQGGALEFMKRALAGMRGAERPPADDRAALEAVFQTMCDEEALGRLDETGE